MEKDHHKVIIATFIFLRSNRHYLYSPAIKHLLFNFPFSVISKTRNYYPSLKIFTMALRHTIKSLVKFLLNEYGTIFDCCENNLL
jgi:hypothetical protein